MSPLPVDLLVMRHAKSSWDSGVLSDHRRPLSARGLRDAPAMASWLRRVNLVPDRVLTSSATRALTTADAVVDEFRLAPQAVTVADDLYHAGVHDWIDRLKAETTAECVLICGHNPTMDALVSMLTRGPLPRSHNGKLMTTAAVAHISVVDGWSSLARRSGRLVRLQRPREL